MQACELALLMWLTTLTGSGQSQDEWVTLQTEPQPLFEGETLTLRCLIRDGPTVKWVYFYKDGTVLHYQRTTELRVERVSKKQDGIYKCSATWWTETIYSAEVQVSVTELPQPALTRDPSGEIFEGDAVTLSCGVEGGSGGWRYLWYKDSESSPPVYQSDSSSGTGAGYTISAAALSHSGEYWCKCGRQRTSIYSQYSKALRIQVHELPQPALTRDPSGEIFDGDAVTLSCWVEGGSGGWRYLWYKDSESSPPVYQTDSSSGTGAGYTISAAALSHSGEYWCRAERERTSLYSQYSHPIWVNVTALFSRVTLTASPGATVKEGEALNLTCEAVVNKTPRPQLHYTIVRDGEPVTNSTDSALYSIASTEKSHTGSYTCAVESQGVKKSSQELHIELQTSWHSTVAVGFSVGFFVILVIVFTLLFLYHKMKVLPCIPGGKWRNHSDQDQDQPAGRVELSKRAQQPESEEIVYCDVDTSKHNPKKKVKPAETDTVYSAVNITAAQPAAANAEAMYATVLPKKKKK
ncbi:Fc receptor-like protein 5 [Acipenser ruthenus]|uniref:Fc receptor-like protein 5 n=1 Tax=Acipenser ruthenus TaxID=7906 RepID=UPI0027428FAE|nr:Fc receptor-like protein 5 [Acipenser ruthenus]